jgi:hypothetical protein
MVRMRHLFGRPTLNHTEGGKQSKPRSPSRFRVGFYPPGPMERTRTNAAYLIQRYG